MFAATAGALTWDGVRSLEEGLREIEGQELRKLVRIFDAVGAQTITYLRSLTNVMRPPARHSIAGDGPRHAHPGGFADVTGILAASYGYRVIEAEGSVVLELRNEAEYAVYLERRDGFYVLSGVADAGGPVERILLEMLERVDPGAYVLVRT